MNCLILFFGNGWMGWRMLYFPDVVDVRYDSLSVYNENFAHHSGICKMNHAGICRLSEKI